MSHSKRNTASAFFTAHERQLLRSTWGSQSTHLARDSLLPFGACRLCLLPARDPVACGGGHVFCRECCVANLLAQKKEIKRVERAWEVEVEEEKRLEELAEGERKEMEEREFERGLVGSGEERKRGRETAGEEYDWARSKRARKEGGDGRISASFWVPGEMEEAKRRAERPRIRGSLCPASVFGPEGPDGVERSDKKAAAKTTAGVHELSLKTLISVHFNEEPGSTLDAPLRTCPACKKGLSNATMAVMVKPCGHVLCRACANKFLVPPERDAHDRTEQAPEDDIVRCYVCSGPASEPAKRPIANETGDRKAKKKDKERIVAGMVEISCEGTGFAGGGKNQIKKTGLAYQC